MDPLSVPAPVSVQETPELEVSFATVALITDVPPWEMTEFVADSVTWLKLEGAPLQPLQPPV